MKKEAILLLLVSSTILVNIILVSACQGVNINSAQLEELDQLIGIGPVYAQRIVDSRPFSSLDDLIRVSGIGNVTLNNIKEQGLACTDYDEDNPLEDSQENNQNNQEIKDKSEDAEDNTTNNDDPQETEEFTNTSTTLTNPNSQKQKTITTKQEVNPNIEPIMLNTPIPLSGNSINNQEQIVYESKNEIIRQYLPYAFCILLIFIIIVLLLKR